MGAQGNRAAGKGLEAFRECVRIAKSAEVVQLCLGEIALFQALLDQQGTQACEAIAVTCGGTSFDPAIRSCLHVSMRALPNMRRGERTHRRRFDIGAGFRIVETTPNAWLTSLLWLVRSAAETTAGSAAKALRCAGAQETQQRCLGMKGQGALLWPTSLS